MKKQDTAPAPPFGPRLCRSLLRGECQVCALLFLLAAAFGLAALHRKAPPAQYRLRGSFTAIGQVTFQLGENSFREGTVLVVEDDFFDDMSDLFILGEPERVFDETESVVMTERAASALFRNRAPEFAVVRCGNRELHCRLGVTGVIRNICPETAPEADFYISRRLYDQVMAGDRP
jgi:hypothetical protein